jgi:hypothetical protein
LLSEVAQWEGDRRLEGEEDKVNLSDFQFPEEEGEGAPRFFFIPPYCSNVDCNVLSLFPSSLPFLSNCTHFLT